MPFHSNGYFLHDAGGALPSKMGELQTSSRKNP
jgi:hypothetical protein